jgi:ferritin-like protein
MSYAIEEITCPFCEKGKIKVRYIPKMLVTRYSHASSNRKSYSYFKNEKYTVISNCHICGKTKEKIEKFLNRGQEEKKISNEEIIRRLKEAGLPTKIVTKS